MSIDNFLTFLPALLLAAATGAIIAYLYFDGQLTRIRDKCIYLSTALEFERKASAEQLAAYQQLNKQLKHTFNSLAADALRDNNAQFIRLAQENLEKLHIRSAGELNKREQAIEGLVKPIREALEKTESQVRKMESDRQQAHGALTRHLETIAESHKTLQGETRNLVQALRRPEVRGQWGELTLKRLAELAGMVEHCDFYEQVSAETGSGKQRPDMVVRMPDRREIIVDAKTPLDAYLSAVEASDDKERTRLLEDHVRNVRARIRELAGKAYWKQFRHSPDFVVLFIPGDQFLGAALDMDHTLIEDALSQQVILATPTSFVALLRAVAYGWRQETLAENAEAIREVGEEMYGRLTTFAEHLSKLGRSLGNSVEAYNRAVGSYDTRILPGVKKFTEMGVASKKESPRLEQVERSVRQLGSYEEPGNTQRQTGRTPDRCMPKA
jgi:DNA recombination protein RmuC